MLSRLNVAAWSHSPRPSVTRGEVSFRDPSWGSQGVSNCLWPKGGARISAMDISA